MTDLEEKNIRRKTPEERLASIPEIPEGMDPIQRARVERKIKLLIEVNQTLIRIRKRHPEIWGDESLDV